MDWSIADIVTATGGRLLYGAVDRRVQDIGIDSRTIAPTALFVAIKGIQFDAHAFVTNVIAKGVKAVVVAADPGMDLAHRDWKAQGVSCVVVDDTTRALGTLANFQRLKMDIPVLAITGSNGKTTTRRLTALVMATQHKTLATEGNLNNEIGLPLTLFKLDHTHQAAVVELGINHFGEMDRLGAICKPTMGMITNVGSAHLEFLGDLERVGQAKGEILAHIQSSGHAILNGDDDHVVSLAGKAPCPVVFFGTSSRADVRAESINETHAGIGFDLVLPDDRVRVQLKTPGRFMVLNALAAATAGHVVGISPDHIRKGLEAYETATGRQHLIETIKGVKIIDDTYNANPDSMAAAIETFSAMRKSSRGFMVLGDMLELGDQAENLHQSIGAIAAAAGAVKLYAHGDYAGALLSGARKTGMQERNLMAGTKEEIASDLIKRIRPKDWLLVKGSRGMAMETVVKAICDWAGTVVD